MALARKRNDDEQSGFCWMAIGNVYCYHENNPEALESYRNAVAYFDRKSITKWLAQVYYNIGLLYDEHLDNPAKSIDAYLKAARLVESIKNDARNARKAWIENVVPQGLVLAVMSIDNPDGNRVYDIPE